jgi:hypothetical protein
MDDLRRRKSRPGFGQSGGMAEDADQLGDDGKPSFSGRRAPLRSDCFACRFPTLCVLPDPQDSCRPFLVPSAAGSDEAQGVMVDVLLQVPGIRVIVPLEHPAGDSAPQPRSSASRQDHGGDRLERQREARAGTRLDPLCPLSAPLPVIIPFISVRIAAPRPVW